MKTKDKAKELVDRFLDEQNDTNELSQAKQCALICVDEIMIIIDVIHIEHMQNAPTLYMNSEGKDQYHYWKEVKQEIEKL